MGNIMHKDQNSLKVKQINWQDIGRNRQGKNMISISIVGQQSENCAISSFGYNNNTIRIQRAVSCQSGNTRGRKDRSKAWEHITDIPVRCRKKFRPS